MPDEYPRDDHIVAVARDLAAKRAEYENQKVVRDQVSRDDPSPGQGQQHDAHVKDYREHLAKQVSSGAEQPADPHRMHVANTMQKIYALRALAQNRMGEANLMYAVADALERTVR